MRQPILVVTSVVLFMGGCGRTLRPPPLRGKPAAASPQPRTTRARSPSPAHVTAGG